MVLIESIIWQCHWVIRAVECLINKAMY